LLSRYPRRYCLATRLYADSFTAQPALADLASDPHHNAAVAAAQAGCGEGIDTGKLGESEKARLRRQALAWLRTDLALWSGQDAARVRKTLRRWLQEDDLAVVREPAALAPLPADERAAWQELWREVQATLDQAMADGERSR
jgi:hypothetical protein